MTTPSSYWYAEGLPDPHAGQYDCERHNLISGELTDDELANNLYLKGDRATITAEEWQPVIDALVGGRQ